MKRTKDIGARNASAILTSDWHLRESQPTCRTDDFWKAQWEKVEFVSHLASQHGCPVLHAGDLFHHWKPSPNLIRMCIKHLPVQFYTVYGQHDLPQHNWELREKSGIAALDEARRVSVLKNAHWGQEPVDASYVILGNFPPIVESKSNLNHTNREILVWHKMVWQGTKLWPGQTDPSSVAILRKYKDYDLILTGDNHKPFVDKLETRIIVNPGSLTRQSADQITHTPRIYLYFADTNTVEPVYLPINPDVVSREHINRSEERDERIEAFVSRLNEDWSADLSFEKSLEAFFQTNKVRPIVKELIYKAIEK